MNPPRVVFDNSKHPRYTLLQVDSANRYGCLLEVVQLLTDLGLTIVKGFISSDGGWFVDEFHVTDGQGNKIQDEGLMALMQEALGARAISTTLSAQQYPGAPQPSKAGTQGAAPQYLSQGDRSYAQRGGAFPAQPLNAAATAGGGTPAVPSVRIEMTGKDRPGLLSQVSALLAEYRCNVIDAQIWTHNQHVACVVHIIPDSTRDAAGSAPAAPGRGVLGGSSGAPGIGHVAELTARLRQVMQGEEGGTPGEGGGGGVAGKQGQEAEVGLKTPEAARGEGRPPGALQAQRQGEVPGVTREAGRLIAMAAAVARERGREGTPSPSTSAGQSPSDAGGATAVWALEDPNALGSNSLGTLYAGRTAAAAASAAARGGAAAQAGGKPQPQAWGLTTCSTKLERRLHQLLAASEGLQEERGALSDRGGPFSSRGLSRGRGEGSHGASTGNLPGLYRGLGLETMCSPGSSVPENSVMGFDPVSEMGCSLESSGSSGGGASGIAVGATVRVGTGITSRRSGASVSVSYSAETGYCILTIRCKDRPRLLFDCVCTLTDMGYVVYHGTIDTEDDTAFQEYYTRRLHGSSVLEEGEQERIVRALEAAIERRRPAEEGVCVEVSGKDRVGLLSDLTKAFHRHNLTVVSATVSTKGSNVVDNFVVAPAVVGPSPLPLPVPSPAVSGIPPPSSSPLPGSHSQKTPTPPRPPSRGGVPPVRSHPSLEDSLAYQQQLRKAGAEVEKEEYVKRVVEEIRQELGGVAQFKVKPMMIPSPPGSSHGPPLSMQGRSLSTSAGLHASREWGLSDSAHGYGGKTGMTPPYRKQQPTFTQMFLQQSGKLFSSLGFGSSQ